MANRLVRNAAILAKIESTYGVDSVPTGGANAMLVRNQQPTPLENNLVDRAVVRAYLGGSEQLTGTRFKRLQFEVDLVGSGTAGTAPAWGPLARMAGMAETIIAATRVDYLPISSAFEAGTIYYHDDGVLHKLLGARGNVVLNLKQGDLPSLAFNFIGIDGGDTAAANPSVTYTNFRTPQIPVDANTGDVTFGGTVSPTGAPAISGGTAYPSMGIEGLDLGHAVNFQPLLGGESVEITDRQSVCKLMLDLTAAQEVAFAANVRGATLQSVGLQHGTVVGDRVLVFMPAVQLTNWTKSELNGKRLVSYDGRVLPLAGNDDVRLVVY